MSTMPATPTPGAAAGNDDPFVRAGRALDAAGVRWCRLRDRGESQEDDLLVAPADLDSARRALGGAGFRELRHPGHGTHIAFVGYDEATDRWPKLDVVTAIDAGRYAEFRTDLAEGCLARREPDADGPRLAPDDAFWTLLLHELLDRPGALPRRADRLGQLAPAARTDSAGSALVAGLLPAGWDPERVITLASSGDAAALGRLGRAIARRWGRREAPSVARRRLVARVARRFDHLDPPFVRRGVSVALLGPDGAGKSSLASRVGQGGPLPTRSVYLGLYGGSRRSPASGGAPKRARRRIPGLGTARRLAAMWRGWLAGWWHVRRGRLVLLDRHPYDARLSGGSGSGARARRAVLGRALPRPDVVIVLDAPAELLYARKPEHPLDRVVDQRHRYLDLARRLPATAVVDVSGSLDEVARRVTAIAWASGASRQRAR
jgi:hypothetical protein